MWQLVGIILFFSLACSKKDFNKTPLNPTNSANIESGQSLSLDAAETLVAPFFAISIQDFDGKPIAFAEVLIGSKTEGNEDGQGPFFRADAAGNVLIPYSYENELITVDAPGFVRASFFNQYSDQKKIFNLRKRNLPNKPLLTGSTFNFGKLKNDGVADFGLVINALKLEDIFSFDITKLISAQTDTMEVAGSSVQVPANLTFPTQRENYYIPITLSKENYKLEFSQQGTHRIYTLHGKFPFKEVVKKIRDNAQFGDLINHFSFVSASIRDIQVEGNLKLNLPVGELNFSNPFQFTVPKVEPDQSLIAISLFEKDGYFMPADFKKIENSQVQQLNTAPNMGTTHIALALKYSRDLIALDAQKAKTLSASLSNVQKGKVSPDLLPLFRIIQGAPNSVLTEIPTRNRRISQLGLYAALSSVAFLPNNRETKTPLWEVYAYQWREEIKLPEWPQVISFYDGNDGNQEQNLSTLPNRWELSFLGGDTVKSLDFGPSLLDSVTHIAYDAKDF